jgi:DNA-binding NarL/FixJ family response regulator
MELQAVSESNTLSSRLPFMQRRVPPALSLGDRREALQTLQDMRSVLDLLAQDLKDSENLADFRNFLERRPRVSALLRGMYGVLFEYDAREHPAPTGLRASALSPRERSVVTLISAGLSNKCIARELKITPETVKSHTRSMLAKLNAKTRAEAVAIAASINII